MPPRSKVDLLPDPVREELERRLMKGGFSGYRDLAAWLAEQGFEISKSSLHAWGQDFEARVGALKRVTAQARAIVAESPDDEGSMNDALIRLTQERVFGLMMDLEIDLGPGELAKVTKAVAELSRASVSQKRLMAEVRAEMERQAREAAAKVADGAARKAGLSADARRRIEEEILGISR